MTSNTTEKSTNNDPSVINSESTDGSSKPVSLVKSNAIKLNPNISSGEMGNEHMLSDGARIISCYALLGGGLGGIILWIAVSLRTLSFIIHWLPMAVFGGALIGSIPSICTAVVLVKRKTILNDPAKWVEVFIVGVVVCALYTIIVIFLSREYTGITSMQDLPDLIVILLIMAGIGGVCSLIIGGFVLPKTESDNS